ncbi:MAG: methyltransferase family protein [Candidatus Rifleibacteriota bacterium]
MGLLNSTGRFFFEWRDKLPVPLVLALPVVARPRLSGWLIGLPLILVGQAVRICSLMHIGPTTRSREVCADTLVTTGPYSCCRNPLYLGNVLKITGITAIAGNIRFAILATIFYALEFCFIIRYEESFLADKFPEEFKKYSQLVPMFLPSKISAKKSSEDTAFSLSEAIKSETKTFMSTVAVLLVLLCATVMREEKQA